ncbi:hypothetical protein HD806DRAFT_179102 [Xylariaceae sp. AK1471]|nr:hypothetical protein HD806DRAFT_179102 [Xylariaceae sp. AK1471]
MRQFGALISSAASAFPFLLISASCYIVMDPPKLKEQWQPAFDSDSIEWDGGAIPLLHSFYGIGVLDWYWRGLTVTFAPATLGSDPLGWWTGFQFLIQLSPLYAIWMLEACRAVNGSGPESVVVLFMFLGQVFGTGVIVPIFHFFLVYFGSTTTDLAKLAPDYEKIQSLLSIRSTPFFLPLLLLFHLPWVAGAFVASRPETRHICVWFWFLTPVWLGLGNVLLTRLSSLNPATPKSSRRATVLAKRHLSVLVGLCVGIWAYMLACAPYSLYTIFVPDGFVHDDLVSHSRLVWQSDFLCTFSSVALFMVYQCVDLYRAGLLKSNDWLLPAVLPIVAVGGGPGTAAAVAWLWREEVMQRMVPSGTKSRV